jgi:hypothetical protein
MTYNSLGRREAYAVAIHPSDKCGLASETISKYLGNFESLGAVIEFWVGCGWHFVLC